MRFERRDDERKRSICILDMSAAKVNKESAAQLRRIQKAEDLKELYAKINRVRNDRERTGVTRIEISKHPTMDPKSCTEWIQVDVPTEVLMHLQKRNQAHFGQAHGSPFTIPPLSDHLGFCGDGWASQCFLDGTYDKKSTTPTSNYCFSISNKYMRCTLASHH
jgi:hypothetical protein